MCFFPFASTLHTAKLHETVLRASFAAQRRTPFYCKFIHASQGVWINLCGRELHSVFQTPFSPPAKLRSNARFAVRKNVGERRTAKSINYVVTAHRCLARNLTNKIPQPIITLSDKFIVEQGYYSRLNKTNLSYIRRKE